MTTAASFRFDALNHEYIDMATGAILPHITGMLERTGWIDDAWFTEESSVRGTAVHRLTADYDLGALDPAQCISAYRGYLLAHVAAMDILKGQGLEIRAVEEALVHVGLRFSGRIDRRVTLGGLRGVLEIKTGGRQKSHPIQTALQAILDAEEVGLPPESLGRWCLYLEGRGGWKLKEDHVEDRAGRDLAEARAVIKACCR